LKKYGAFLGRDIIQLIEDQIDDFEEKHQEVQECNIDQCEYDMTAQEHVNEEFMLVGRKQALRDLKSRISSQEVEER
jgi:hypothetical protein